MIISVGTYIVSLLNYPTPRTRQLPSLFALNLGSQNRPSSHRFGPQADASGHLQNKTSSCPSDQLGVDIRDGSTALETWKTHIGKKAGVTLEHYSTVKNIWLGFMNIQYLDPKAWVPCVAVFGKAVCVFGVGSLAQVLCLHLDLRSAAKAVWNAKSLPVSSPLLPKSWWQSCLGFGLAPTLLKTRIPWREQVVAAVLLKLPPYLTTRLEILKEQMVFEPQSYISYRFMWLSSCDAGWWDMFGTRYTIFGCYVLSENVSGITPLMISEVDPMENCDSLFSGKQWYFICNWWLLIGIPTNTPSANLSLSPKPSHLLCHPIDSTEVGVQHPAHHLQKPDLFSQGSTAWYWCDKIDFEHITKSRRWTTVHHIAPQKLNIFGCLPILCMLPKKG